MALETCAFCRKNISHEIPHSTHPDLCHNCAEKEVKRVMKTRGTHPDQKRLF